MRSPLIGLLAIFSISCNKLVQINPPANSITTSQVFDDSADAASAVAGMYTQISNNSTNILFGNGGISMLSGSSADELLIFGSYFGGNGNDMMYNQILAQQDGGFIDSYFWSPAYTLMYQANSIIAGVNASTGIPAATKAEFTGEALFFRAFLNFYLVNLFGPVPIITSTDYKINAAMARSPTAQVYQQIIGDLLTAQGLLAADYSAGGGERIRANKWAATALLARAYLYDQKWDSAELEASNIINNASMFALNPDLNSVFLKDNTEAILQWNDNTAYQPFNSLAEGYFIIPYNNSTNPNVYLNQQLLNAFEPGDLREADWVDSTTYQGTVYYYPFKYKVGPAQSSPNAPATEYYMVLRLAEQYLIRAEARVQQNTNLAGAITDLNILRERANLPDLAFSLPQRQILSAVMQERRIELFAEWGNRWLDLKRTGAIDSIMTIATPLKGGGSTWNSYQQLYPIPYSEMQESPNFTQNAGY